MSHKHLPDVPALPRPQNTESSYDKVLSRQLFHAFMDIYHVWNNEAAVLDHKNIFKQEQAVRLDDAINNGVSYGFTISHRTTGTPANGIGVGLRLEAETATDNFETGASLEAITTDVTASSEDFDLVFRTMAAGTLSEIARFSRTATATHTGLMLWDTDNGTVERVTVGAADSGGVGFKLLRIPN